MYQKYFLAVLSLGMFSSLSVIAQVEKRADTTTFKLKELIVTGERKESSTIETPLAISTVTHRDLERTRGYGLDEALASVPGVFAQSRYGNQDVRITIRGFGARGAGERSNAGTSRGIRILSDGIPETEPDGRTSFDLIDLASAGKIEVVRSNASAVWGNAAGGVINVTTSADFDHPFVNVQSMFGSFGYRKEHVSIGSMLESGRFYFSLSNTNFDGWRDHSASSQFLAKTGVITELGERTSVAVHLTATTNVFHIPGPLTQEQFDANPQQAQADTLNYLPSYVQRDERRFNRLGRIGATLLHEIDDGHSISAMAFVGPKYLQRSERNTFRDFNRYHAGGNIMYTNRFSIMDLFTNTFQFGVDEAYQDGGILFYSLVNGQRGTTLRDNKREGTNNFGAFMQEEINVNEAITILLGGRYDNITYYTENFFLSKLSDSKSFEHITPKAGFTCRFTPLHSVYANVGGGVEVPAGNETDPPATFGQDTVVAINPLLNPIRSTTFEVGTKQFLLMDASSALTALQYDVALYLINVTDDIIPYRGGRFYFTAGKTQRLGAEMSIDAQWQHGFSLQAALSISKNTYEDYRIDSVHYGKPNVFADLSGNTIAGIPEMLYNLRLRYEPTFLPWLFMEISMRGVGEYFSDDVNSLRVDGYMLMNASFGIRDLHLTDHLVLRAFAGLNNLTDKRYAASSFINPDYDRSGKHAIYLEPGMPRNFVASITIGWEF